MVPTDGDKEKAASKPPAEADNASDNQSTPLLARQVSPSPGASASGAQAAAPTTPAAQKPEKKTEKPKHGVLKHHTDELPIVGIEELHQQVRERVEQILSKTCEQAVESIMQVTAASLQQVASPSKVTIGNGQSAEHKHVGWKPLPGAKSATVITCLEGDDKPDRADSAGSMAKAMNESSNGPTPQLLGSETKVWEDETEAPVLEIWERCHACYNEYQPDAKFCRNCGVMRVNFPKQEKWVSCHVCGNQYQPDAKFCRKCGTRREYFAPIPPKSQLNSKNGKYRKSRKSHNVGRRTVEEGSIEETLLQEKPRGIFANSDDMKRQLREAISQPDYDVSRFYYQEGCFQAIAKSTLFDNMTLVVIAFNAIWIAIDCDFNPATVLTEAPPIFQVVDNLFCFYFVFEWAVRFGAFARKKDCLKDAWFVFDSIMVIIMVLETWVMTLLIMIFSSGSGEGLGDASLLKIVRLVRLVRMARVIRILNALPELMVLIKGMFVATRAVSCTVSLMLIIIYIFAVVFRQLTSDSAFGKRRFPDVPRTMRYLLLQSTMPDLYDAATEIWEEGWMYALLFLFFLLVVAITVMNMLVGVLVGVVNTVASVEKEQLMVNFVKTNLLTLLRSLSIDRDDDGQINLIEFKALIEIPEAIRSFDSMGVDVVGLVDLSDFIFKDGRSIPFADFMELVMQLRGTNQATVKDIVDLRKFILLENKRFERMLWAATHHKGEASMALGKLEKAKALGMGGSQAEILKDDHMSPFIETKETVFITEHQTMSTEKKDKDEEKKTKIIKKPEKKSVKHVSHQPLVVSE